MVAAVAADAVKVRYNGDSEEEPALEDEDR